MDVNLSGEDREDIGGILFAREIQERFEYTFTPNRDGDCHWQYGNAGLPGAALLPVHYEAISQGAGGKKVVQKVLEKESREKPPVIVVKKRRINYQLKCEDIRYLEAIPRGTRLHLVTENWDVPLCDSQTDAA